jgi:hypothetical protein
MLILSIGTVAVLPDGRINTCSLLDPNGFPAGNAWWRHGVPRAASGLNACWHGQVSA